MAERPLVSMILLTYNQERFVRDAVRSALAQTYQPLEIVISDDCSIDNTFEIIREETADYRGPHRIILNRNQKNLGLATHYSRVIEMSRGEFIVGHAGDDISVPDRTEKLVNRWLDPTRPVDLVCSYFAEIDIDGSPTGFVKKHVTFVPDTSKDVLLWQCGATGACAGFSRKLVDKYGRVDSRVISEDWVYSFRAWLESGIGVVEEPLVHHRTHDASLGVIHRSIELVADRVSRRELRRKGAGNELGIAREWLKAWQISGKKDDRIASELQRLVRLKEIKFRAFDATRLEVLRMVFDVLKNRGRPMDLARLLVRHLLRWD